MEFLKVEILLIFLFLKKNCKSSFSTKLKKQKKNPCSQCFDNVIWLWDWWRRSVELGCALVQSRSNKSRIQEFHRFSCLGISSIPGLYQTYNHVWVILCRICNPNFFYEGNPIIYSTKIPGIGIVRLNSEDLNKKKACAILTTKKTWRREYGIMQEVLSSMKNYNVGNCPVWTFLDLWQINHTVGRKPMFCCSEKALIFNCWPGNCLELFLLSS